MKFQLFVLPTVPATMEERERLRPIGRNNERFQMMIEEVRNSRRADVRAGDVITAVTSRGQTTDIKSTEQFNKVLAQLDPGMTLTLHVRRGESNLFVTVRGEASPG